MWTKIIQIAIRAAKVLSKSSSVKTLVLRKGRNFIINKIKDLRLIGKIFKNSKTHFKLSPLIKKQIENFKQLHYYYNQLEQLNKSPQTLINKNALKKLNQKIKDLEKETTTLDKIYENQLLELSKKENNKNIYLQDKETKNFDDFISKLTQSEKKRLENIIKHSKEVDILFSSSWLEWGTFIPLTKIRDYKKDLNKYNLNERAISPLTRGLMRLKTIETSKNNPSGIYTWINVLYRDWLKIIKVRTGKNFWNVWYHKNRKNMMVLLPNSIYYRTPKTKKIQRRK